MTDNRQLSEIKEHIFPIIGTLYDGMPYPDELLITYSIIQRLDGEDAAEKQAVDASKLLVEGINSSKLAAFLHVPCVSWGGGGQPRAARPVQTGLPTAREPRTAWRKK